MDSFTHVGIKLMTTEELPSVNTPRSAVIVVQCPPFGPHVPAGAWFRTSKVMYGSEAFIPSLRNLQHQTKKMDTASGGTEDSNRYQHVHLARVQRIVRVDLSLSCCQSIRGNLVQGWLLPKVSLGSRKQLLRSRRRTVPNPHLNENRCQNPQSINSTLHGRTY